MAIHRFKCSPELNNAIIDFSALHRFDTKDTLLEQWNCWMETSAIKALVEKEREFLQRHGYPEELNVKIFKSIKYYYIKKMLSKKEEKTVQERTHTRLSLKVKRKIQEHLEQHFANNPNFKPADAYMEFKKSLDSTFVEPEPLIKKGYKNQYYQLKHKKYSSILNVE